MDPTGHGVPEFYDTLGELHALVLGVAEVETFLEDVARLAAAAFEADIACGITTRYDHNPLTAATSDRRAAIADEEQYGAGEGPCMEALSTGRIVDVPDQEADRRWESYGRAAVALGVKCSLSLPLFVGDKSVGALNLYDFQAPQSFGPAERRRAEVFVAQASTALTLALRFNHQQERARQLVEALHARSVIDQALGIIMFEQRCDATTAFDLLRRRSQSANRKLRHIAAELVEHASGHPVAALAAFEDLDLPDPR